jgi:DNA-directed RNA polymerase subunit RPC12/RpoP
MAEWFCFKCKEKMVEDRIWMRYLEFERQMPGLKCPKCGASYLLEETVVITIRTLEEALEAK